MISCREASRIIFLVPVLASFYLPLFGYSFALSLKFIDRLTAGKIVPFIDLILDPAENRVPDLISIFVAQVVLGNLAC